MSNMPFEDSVFFIPLYRAAKEGVEYNSAEDTSDRAWYKKQLDRMRGREGRQRKQVSIDEFMGEMSKNG